MRREDVIVIYEPRPDGGLRAWSPNLPGFLLSHSNPQAVYADVEPVLSVMLDPQWWGDK